MSQPEQLTIGEAAPLAVSRYRLALVAEPEPVPYPGETLTMTPKRAARFLRLLLDGEPFETFGALLLDTRLQVTGHVIAHRGGLGRCVVEPRAIFGAAILANAASVLLFHNHPSGDATPSPEDIGMTTRFAEAGHLLGVQVVDHLVIGNGSGKWCSLRESGAWRGPQ